MLITIERVHVTTGSGKTVHLASKGAAHTLCGSGYCTTGAKRSSRLRICTHEVTCKKCLRLEQEGHAQQFGANLYSSLTGNDTLLMGEL
jgi:hypothetical protein